MPQPITLDHGHRSGSRVCLQEPSAERRGDWFARLSQTPSHIQTLVSRTGARLTARHLEDDGRGALMFCRCFMFQMFHSSPRPRRRDPQRAALQQLRRRRLLARGQNPTGQFDRDSVALLFRQP